MARMVFVVDRDDLGLAGLHARGDQLVFLHHDLQARQDTVRPLARVLAEADKFIAGQHRALDRRADVFAQAREIEREFRDAELEQLLRRRTGRAPHGIGLDLRLLAEADDQRALIFIAQQNRRANRAFKFRRRHAGRKRTSLHEKVNEIRRANRGSTNVDFESRHLERINKISGIRKGSVLVLIDAHNFPKLRHPERRQAVQVFSRER